MLSVLFAESADNLAHLVRFYAPQAKRLLDVTHGSGTLTKRCPIPVVSVDKDATTTAKVIADSTALPFLDSVFTVAVVDPPYLYGTPAAHMGLVGQKTWTNARSTWKAPHEFTACVDGIARELYRVLADEGVVFGKVMDSRFKGRIVRNHDLMAEAFEGHGFRLRDQIVYLRTVTGSFVNPKSAQSSHGYFLVFQKMKARRLPLETGLQFTA